MFWLFFLAVSCLTEILERETRGRTVSFVVSEAKTVYFIQTKVERPKKTSSGLTVDNTESVHNVKTSIVIYRDVPFIESTIVHNDEKRSLENTFFFTTPYKGKYYVVLSLDKYIDTPLALNHKIYTGEANRPAIVSSNDVEVSKAEVRIRKLLDYVKTNITMQNMEYENEEVYRQLYADIFWKAIYVVLLKVTATLFTLGYSGWKTRQFFTTQGLTGQKN